MEGRPQYIDDSSNLKRMLEKRKTLIHNLRFYCDRVNELDANTIQAELANRMQRLERKYTEFEGILTALANNDQYEAAPLLDENVEIGEAYIKAISLLQSLYVPPAAHASNDTAMSPQLDDTRMPTIEIPTCNDQIDRCLGGLEALDIETHHCDSFVVHSSSTPKAKLIGCGDASMSACAAAVFLRTDAMHDCKISIACAKRKVASIPPQTIPKLELNTALLLANLLTGNVLHIDPKKIIAFSDSKVFLSWMKGEPDRWTKYVAHRTSQIRKAVDPGQWHYGNTKNNPADIASH